MHTEKRHSGFNQALWLGISQASAFALAFISSAILSRYFDKNDYGTYKQVLYVYATLQTVFTAGLPGVFSYFIPRLTSEQGKTLVGKITQLFFILGLAFSLLLFFSADLIASILENPDLSLAIRVFSPFPLLTIPTMGVEGIYTALKKTKYIAIYQIISKLAMLICIVLPVVLFNGTYITAIIGWGIASLITFIVAIWMKSRPYVGIQKELIPGMYRAVFTYSIPLMGASLVGMVLHSANQFYISRFYGTDAFANFSNGFIPLPFVAMVAGSVKSVLLPLFSKAQATGTIDQAVQTYNSAVNQCIVILYPILTFFLFFASDIVTVIFSEKYFESAVYLQLSLFKDYIEVLPYFPMLMAFGKSNIYFIIHLIFAIILWLLDYLVVIFDMGPELVSAVSSLCQIGIVMSALCYIKFKIGVNIMTFKALKTPFIVLCSSVIVAGISKYSTSHFIPTIPLLNLIIGAIIYISVLYLVGIFTKIDYLQSFRKLLKR